MLNMAICINQNYNANQNHNEVPSHTGQNDPLLKSIQITNAGENVKKREPSYTVGRNLS